MLGQEKSVKSRALSSAKRSDESFEKYSRRMDQKRKMNKGRFHELLPAAIKTVLEECFALIAD
jgi:hypothetical protein